MIFGNKLYIVVGSSRMHLRVRIKNDRQFIFQADTKRGRHG